MWPFKRSKKSPSLPKAHAGKTQHEFSQWVPTPVLPDRMDTALLSDHARHRGIHPVPSGRLCRGLTWRPPPVDTVRQNR